MDVENFSRELPHEPGREQAHVTGKTDEVYLVIQKCGHNFAVMLLARLAFRWDDDRIEATMAGDFLSGSIGAIRNHDRNPGIGYPAFRNAVSEGYKVGAPSG